MKSLAELICAPWALERTVFVKMAEIFLRHDQGIRLSEAQVTQAIEAAGKKQVSGDGRTMEVEDGVAVIPIQGVIAKHSAMVQGISGPEGTSVEGIRQHLNAALADASVTSILLQVDSPGGAVSGIDELGEEIRAARETKPIVAFADDMMASAAYWLGAQAETVLATRSSQVGSIGVYSAMVDLDRALKNDGINVELISAGEGKVDGHPWAAITEQARNDVRESVDEVYTMFVDAVNAGRGIARDRIIGDIQAKVYGGQNAKNKRLVDRVVSNRGEAVAFARALAGTRAGGKGVVAMSEITETVVVEPSKTAPEPAAVVVTPIAASPRIELVSADPSKDDSGAQERERMLALDRLAADWPAHSELISKCKEEGVTLAEADRRLLAAERARQNHELKLLKEDGSRPLAGAPAPEATEFSGDPKTEEYWTNRWEKDAVLQADFASAESCAKYMTQVAPKQGFPKALKGVDFAV